MNPNQKKWSKGSKQRAGKIPVSDKDTFLPPTGRVLFHLGGYGLKECRF